MAKDFSALLKAFQDFSDADDFATSECDRLGLSLSHPQIQKLVYAGSRIPLAIQFALGQMLDGVAYDDS